MVVEFRISFLAKEETTGFKCKIKLETGIIYIVDSEKVTLISFDLDRRQAFCQYCGNTLLIDDENTVNINAVTWMEQGSRRADG